MKAKFIILNSILTFSLILILISCNDDFMERYPLDKVNDKIFWSSAIDLELYCNPFYHKYIPGHGKQWANAIVLPFGYTESPAVYGDMISDNMAPSNYSKTAAGKVERPPSAGSGGWSWENIRGLNYFLVNYNRAKIDVKTKNIYAGEISLFKAWDYFNKIKGFGDVPWLTNPLESNSPELYKPRTPRVQVMDSVLMLLNQAILWLPEKGKEKADRLNKDIALHLKARICLHEGTFRKYHQIENALKFIQEAANASKTLIESGQYRISSTGNARSDYYNLFCQYDYSNNKEIILWKKYKENEFGHSTARFWDENSREKIGLQKNLIEEYLCDDGLPISTSKRYLGDDSLQVELANRDPRLIQTVCPPGNNYMFSQRKPWMQKPLLPGMDENHCTTGYRVAKWWINDPTEWSRVLVGIQACPVFRYAETLLIYAEAMAELGLCDQNILDITINTLRDRVNMPHLRLTTIPSDASLDEKYMRNCSYIPDPLLREIRRERRIELAVENFRFDDLMRWKAGKFLNEPVRGLKFQVNQYYQYNSNGDLIIENGNPKPHIVVGKDIYLDEKGYIIPYFKTLPDNERSFDESKDYYFPIPIEDIVLNPNLTQNPGW